MEGSIRFLASTSARSRKAVVRLTPQQRTQLESIARNGSTKSKRFIHARALLMADEDHPLGRYTDQQIGETLGVAAKTIARIRGAFLLGGITVAVERKERQTPPIE